MSTFMRHQKEIEKFKNISRILAENFNGDKSHYQEAKEIYDAKKTNLKKLKNVSNILASIAVLKSGDDSCKTTHFDLNNNVVSFIYPLENPALLSYTLDNLSTRRIFPYSISSLINKNISKDILRKKNTREQIQEVSRFLRQFCSSYNLTVNKIQYNKQSKIFDFETTQRDQIYGSTKQYITVVLDKNKQFQINSGIKDSLANLSQSYSSLLSFFSCFGFSDIYARCSCKNYMGKYSKRRGMQNYCCNHLLYSLSMFPYYLVTLLSNQ